MYRTAFNSGSTPLTVSVDGRSIGGSDWGTVETTDAVARELLASGALVLVDQGEGEQTPAAAAAFARTEAWTARREQAGALDKDVLIETLRENAPDVLAALPRGADDTPSKDDLAAAVAERQQIEISRTTTRRSRKQED